tara:strand:+ start:4679 stop:4981 length:303 start_codon:yes stop_codon:yes gene_type:complete
MKQNTQIYKPNSNTLKLNTFKKLYKSLKTPWKPLNWIILGYLIGIENRYIDIVSKQTVDTAIENYKKEIEEEEKVIEIDYSASETGLLDMSIGIKNDKNV